MLLGPLVRSLLLATLPLSLALAQAQPPVQFRPLTKRWMPTQSDDAIYAADLTLADVDGDGDLDVFVGRSGQDRLYRNDGRGVFEDVTSSQLGTGSQGTDCAVFVDVDGDGDLDLVKGLRARTACGATSAAARSSTSRSRACRSTRAPPSRSSSATSTRTGIRTS